jgi:hypothetical protein
MKSYKKLKVIAKNPILGISQNSIICREETLLFRLNTGKIFEFSTNCESHASSLRHDEAMYRNIAYKLRDEIANSFPMIKILLKPLIFDPIDRSIESLTL